MPLAARCVRDKGLGDDENCKFVIYMFSFSQYCFFGQGWDGLVGSQSFLWRNNMYCSQCKLFKGEWSRQYVIQPLFSAFFDLSILEWFCCLLAPFTRDKIEIMEENNDFPTLLPASPWGVGLFHKGRIEIVSNKGRLVDFLWSRFPHRWLRIAYIWDLCTFSVLWWVGEQWVNQMCMVEQLPRWWPMTPTFWYICSV